MLIGVSEEVPLPSFPLDRRASAPSYTDLTKMETSLCFHSAKPMRVYVETWSNDHRICLLLL